MYTLQHIHTYVATANVAKMFCWDIMLPCVLSIIYMHFMKEEQILQYVRTLQQAHKWCEQALSSYNLPQRCVPIHCNMVEGVIVVVTVERAHH